MLLNKKDFSDWLDNGNDYDTVGIGMSDTNCPIASFLSEKLGGAFVSVFALEGYKTISNNGEEVWTPIPNWVREFIETIDDSYADDLPVDRAGAKQIFNSITL